MDQNKSLTIEEIFNLAIKNHQEGKTDIAQKLYNQVIKINPNHADAFNNLGLIFEKLKDYQKAKDCYEKAIIINLNHSPALNNLGNCLRDSGEFQKAINCYEKAIETNSNYAEPLNNLGNCLRDSGEFQKAINCYEKAIEINPNYADAFNNLGNVFKNLEEDQKAIKCYEKTIAINPNYAEPHYNLGNCLRDSGGFQKAINCYEKAIEINPNYADAYGNLGAILEHFTKNKKIKDCYEKAIEINPNHVSAHWNLHGLSADIDEALLILKKLYKVDNKHTKAKIMISILGAYKGNFSEFNNLLSTPELDHAFVRSAKWVFSLPKLPEIFFNRWIFFDAVIKLADHSRPFYEFGVWNGYSFQYLINTFKKGFGFDTFTGLPQDWHHEPKGAYSSFGAIPKIEGGEFIVGKFEDTLPDFFSKEKPKASLINFDADLYSSTLCALNYSNKVIDENTILIFDEFIMNNKWEQDEYKALNEFCDNLSYTYEVLAVSFFTKQVAVKLKKN